MTRIALINPNSNVDTTAMMVAIAASVSDEATLQGFTARHAPKLITDPTALLDSAAEVVQIGGSLQGYDGIIVAAFGDPGAARLAHELTIPVIGIGAAAAQKAARLGLPFAVVTTTAHLVAPITELMRQHGGAAQYLGTFVPAGHDVAALMAQPAAMDAALLHQTELATRAGARQIIIGGGPLGAVAERLGPRVAVPLIHPIKEAVRACLAHIKAQGGGDA